MARFEIGQRVKIINSDMPEYNGIEGVIEEQGRGTASKYTYWDWWIVLDGDVLPRGFDEREFIAAESPSQPAPGGEVADPFAAITETHTTPYDALVFAIQCAKVAAMPQDTWRNNWTPGQTVNEMASTIDEQAHEIDTLARKVAALEAALNTAQGYVNDAESALYRVQTRLPMTDSCKDVNQNRMDLRQIAREYFDTHPASALQAAGAQDASAGRDGEGVSNA
jgi:hypothetical protein